MKNEVSYEFLENILVKKNLKVTPQRLLILSLIRQFGHLDVDELYAKITVDYPYISLATIYKNISTMVENGILNEVKIGGAKTKYELSTNSHAHFICIQCKKIEDLDINVDCLLDNFNKGSVASVNVLIYGTCNACQSKISKN
ncbi:MAG: Fur family transcriptional regulator [Desulfurella sp.]|jgi:Fe2+ or Zn2+ uptake regulation protein